MPSRPNRVYGLKLFSHQFDQVAGAGWARRLPGLRFIHLTRADLLGQAISRVRAVQTGRYKAGDRVTGAALYDRAAIADALARTAYGQARWECWFARNAIAPLRLRYEDAAADPQRTVEAIAGFLGLGETPQVDRAAIGVEIQRDETSEQWRARFLEEAGDTAYLDGGRLFSRFRRGGRFARWFLGPRSWP